MKEITKAFISIEEMPNVGIASVLQSIVSGLTDSQYKIEDSI